MRRVTLLTFPESGKPALECSALGFGCVSLTMHRRVAGALELLEEAFAAGITHYDVARLYGYGQAEGILGRFLQGKRDRVTVTTKLGLEPPALARHRHLVSVGRRVVRQFPGLLKLLRRPAPAKPGAAAPDVPAASSAPPPLNPSFDPDRAARSLETSLRELRTDYVDVLLLHECTLADARREDLVRFLEDQVRAGKVRCCGVGTAPANLRGRVHDLPDRYRVLQLENNPLAPSATELAGAAGLSTGPENRALVTHTALQPLRQLLQAAKSNPALARRHGGPAGVDLTDPTTLAGLLLAWAAAHNPGGVVLVATTRREHLASNIEQFLSGQYADEQVAALSAFAAEATGRETVGAAGEGAS